jgi:nicotinate-nucleotide adenylyltransferase
VNLAIFGGSFDPPHIAHEQIALKICNELDIDKLLIVPTYLNPFKSTSHFTPKQRFYFVDELFKDNKKIEVSDFELLQNQTTPSIVTVKYFIEQYKPNKFYLVIGSDNLAKLHLWDDFNTLKDLVEFVIVHREGYEVKNDIIKFKEIILNMDISSTWIRNNLCTEHIPQKIKNKVQNIWKKESKE